MRTLNSTAEAFLGGSSDGVALPRQNSVASHVTLPASPTPLRAWFWAFVIAVSGGVSAVYPRAGIAVLAAVVAGYVAFRVMARPFLAVLAAFCIFPLFALLRATHGAYNLPVFAGGIRTFPEVLITIAGLGLLGRLARRTAAPPRLFQDDIPVVFWIAGGAYAFAIALSDHLPLFGPLNGWWVSITPAVFYLLVRWSRPGEAGRKAFLRVLLTTFLLLAVGSFLDYIFRPVFLMRLADSERAYFVPPGWPRELYWKLYPRMQSLLYEENLWGSLCAFVSLGCITQFAERRKRASVVALFLLSTAGMILSMSRGGFICWVVGLLVLLVMRGRHQRGVAAAVVAVVVVSGTILTVWGAVGPLKSVVDRLNTVSVASAQKGEIANDRTSQWHIGWDIFKRNPSGTGLGTLGYAAHLSGVGTHTIGDGIYFRILAEQGIPGFILSVLSLVGTGWVILRHLYSCSPVTRRYGLSLLAFHCGWLVQSVGANTYDFFYIAPLFWTAFGLYVDQCQCDEARSRTTPPSAFLLLGVSRPVPRPTP